MRNLRKYAVSMLRYFAAPAYVLGMMAVTIGPLLYAPYTGPAPAWFAKPKPPVVKANKLHDRLVPRVVTVEIIRKGSK